jgi:hypothetical protein
MINDCYELGLLLLLMSWMFNDFHVLLLTYAVFDQNWRANKFISGGLLLQRH